MTLVKSWEFLYIVPSNKCFPFHLAKPPVLSAIKATPSRFQGDEKVILEISISDFAPCDIRVAWYKDWKKLTDDTNPNNFHIGANKLCYLISQITVDPKQKDVGEIIRCEVHHPATKKFQEKSFILKGRGKNLVF